MPHELRSGKELGELDCWLGAMAAVDDENDEKDNHTSSSTIIVLSCRTGRSLYRDRR